MHRETKFSILLTVFVASLSVVNIITAKIGLVNLFGLELTFAVGVVAYGITFPITDAVAETFGHRRARTVVWLGLLANLVVVIFTQMAIAVPVAPFWEDQHDAYARLLGAVPQIVVGSLAAYLVAQFHDLWAFRFWRRVTGGKHLWLRNNLSTITSQLLDTTVFTLIAFAGSIPFAEMPRIVLSGWFLKCLVAFCDTPLVYLVVWWLGGSRETDLDA